MSLYFAIIVGTLARLWQLGNKPFNGDEGVILWQVTQPNWHEFITAVGRDAHPPLIHLLSWLGIHIFGTSEFGLRFFSALFGVLTIPASYALAKEVLDRKKALLVAWFVALSPYLLFFSKEARMYAPLTLFVVMALWAVTKQRWNYFAIFTALAIYTHYLGLLLLVLALFKKSWRGLTGAIILVLPLAPIAIPQFIGRLHEAGGVAIGTNVKGIINALYRFGAGRTYLGLELNPHDHLQWLHNNPLSWVGFIVTLVVPAVLLLYGLFKHWRSEKLRLLLVFAALSLLLALVSTEVGSRAARNLAFLAPIYYIIAVAGLYELNRVGRLVATAAMVAIFALGIGSYFFKEAKKPGANSIVRYIHDQNIKDAAVLARGSFLHGESTIFNYYWRTFWGSPPPPVIDYYGDYHIGNIGQLREQSVSELVHNQLANHATVFFYDFSYQPHDLKGEPAILGTDSENQPIALWRINR